ncbi:F-box only protein 7-like isoform X2 [Pomacea canaliculata]|uniref:F-box only protein 7-like isoform X2 n=1 Tax=Pomacea canaliculata TaxID=400727 RepID=UPI000D73E858|nr:F-box only protein 7-like isoform X2 [Pomacea canaliculata]
MKLKVKYLGDVRTLEVAGEPQDIILADLTNITTDLFHLQRSVVLSLNKKDALRGDELTLAQLGIVSGDLLFVLEAESPSTSPGISSEELRNIDAGAQADKQGLPASASSSACESISSGCSGGHSSSFLSPIGLLHSHSYENAGVGRENTDNCSTVANGGIPRKNTESDSQAGRNGQSKDEGGPDNLHRQHFVDEEDANVPGPSAASASLEGQNDPAFLVQSLPAQDPEVNRCLQEPLLCRESSPIAVPVMLRDLYAGAQCCKVADALWVAVHALMMEVGLRPQEDASLSMGEHWNTEGFYKRTYRHTIADARYSCAVVGIPMGGSLILHGVISGDPPFTTEKVQLRVADFVCGSGVSNDVCSVYRNLERLSRLVKDMICQPLLAQLAEECGYPVSLGLLCLSHELKLKVLSYLPACSLVRMGQVCQLFASMYCDPWLWRRLYLREFGRPALQAKMARKTSAVKGHDTNTSNPAILGGSLPSALHSTCATTLC